MSETATATERPAKRGATNRSDMKRISAATSAGLLAMMVGASWTIVPAWLKARHGINEIVTTLMMSFIGVGLAAMLIKGPFDGPGGTPQTEILPAEAMLTDLPGTTIHIGVLLALAVCVIVYLVFARTSFGTRLDVIGANPRAAVHLGIHVPRLIVVAFLISGALIGLSSAYRTAVSGA